MSGPFRHPSQYMGNDATNPPQLVIMKRQPTINDLRAYTFGTIWLMTDPQEVWMLCGQTRFNAEWRQLFPGAGSGATNFVTDNGTATEIGGVLKVKGVPGKNILTDALVDPAGDTVSVKLTDTVTISGNFTTTAGTITSEGTITSNTGDIVSSGGDIKTMSGTVFCHDAVVHNDLQLVARGATPGVMQTDGVGVVSSSIGTQGTVMMSGASAPAVWGTIEAADASITVDTATAGKIKLAATGGTVGSGMSFMAYLPSNESVVAGNYFGTVKAWTTQWDTTGGFYPGDGAGTPLSFTAPVTGKYYIDAHIYIDPSSFQDKWAWETPNGTFQGITAANGTFGTVSQGSNTAFLVSLNAGQIIKLKNISGSWDAIGDAGGGAHGSWVSGFLLQQFTSTVSMSFMAIQKQNAFPYLSDPSSFLINYIGSIQHPLVTEWDTTGGFYPGDGAGGAATFTAPVSGKYQFNMAVAVSQISGFTFSYFPDLIFESNGLALLYNPHYYMLTKEDGPSSSNAQCVLNLSAGDVVKFGVHWAMISSSPPAPTGGFTLYALNPSFTMPLGYPPTYQTWVSGQLIG